jgi:hypothetical protein
MSDSQESRPGRVFGGEYCVSFGGRCVRCQWRYDLQHSSIEWNF